jgi:hypothetical protein
MQVAHTLYGTPSKWKCRKSTFNKGTLAHVLKFQLKHRFLLCFNVNFNACSRVKLCCMQRPISKALLLLLWRFPDDGTQGVPTQSRKSFCASAVYIIRECKAGFVSWSSTSVCVTMRFPQFDHLMARISEYTVYKTFSIIFNKGLCYGGPTSKFLFILYKSFKFFMLIT